MRHITQHVTVLTLLTDDSDLDIYHELSAAMKEGNLLEDYFARIKVMIKYNDHLELHLVLWFLVQMESVWELAVELGKLDVVK